MPYVLLKIFSIQFPDAQGAFECLCVISPFSTLHQDGEKMQGLGWVKKGAGIKKYKLVVTEQPWRCKVQHREYSQ